MTGVGVGSSRGATSAAVRSASFSASLRTVWSSLVVSPDRWVISPPEESGEGGARARLPAVGHALESSHLFRAVPEDQRTVLRPEPAPRLQQLEHPRLELHPTLAEHAGDGQGPRHQQAAAQRPDPE